MCDGVTGLVFLTVFARKISHPFDQRKTYLSPGGVGLMDEMKAVRHYLMDAIKLADIRIKFDQRSSV